MPNWCSNSVMIHHEDSDKIDQLVDAFEAQRLFDQIIPIPEILKNSELSSYGGQDSQKRDNLREEAQRITGWSNEYDFCVSNWGTKWDVGGDGSCSIHDENHAVSFNFETAWAPPIGIYEELAKQGYTVNAYYYEPGMSFCGNWTSSHGDDYYEIQGGSGWVVENIPQEISDAMGIIDLMEEWEQTED